MAVVVDANAAEESLSGVSFKRRVDRVAECWNVTEDVNERVDGLCRWQRTCGWSLFTRCSPLSRVQRTFSDYLLL